MPETIQAWAKLADSTHDKLEHAEACTLIDANNIWLSHAPQQTLSDILESPLPAHGLVRVPAQSASISSAHIQLLCCQPLAFERTPCLKSTIRIQQQDNSKDISYANQEDYSHVSNSCLQVPMISLRLNQRDIVLAPASVEPMLSPDTLKIQEHKECVAYLNDFLKNKDLDLFVSATSETDIGGTILDSMFLASSSRSEASATDTIMLSDTTITPTTRDRPTKRQRK
jgi:hypothetical protein